MLTEIENYIKAYPILVSIISGVISSAIFLIILSRLKPNLSISHKIAYDQDTDRSYIKVLNKSLFYKTFDISSSLYAVKLVQNYNGENTTKSSLKLRVEYVKTLNRFNWRHCFQNLICGQKRLNYRTDYAVVFIYDGDLRKILDDHNFIRFEVYSKHTLTGFAKIFIIDYRHSAIIEEGVFLSGNTFNIKKC